MHEVRAFDRIDRPATCWLLRVTHRKDCDQSATAAAANRACHRGSKLHRRRSGPVALLCL
jgi:hypothetical protein